MFSNTVDTPAGPLHTVVDDDGVVRAMGFGSRTHLLERLGSPATERTDLGVVSKAIDAYLDGDLTAWDDLPVEQPGGPFMQIAWTALREVRAGETVSYGELAALAGRPTAVRAAGQACARNLIAPIIPCHRILASTGKLNGYYYGLPVKQWLLDHEGAVTSASRPSR